MDHALTLFATLPSSSMDGRTTRPSGRLQLKLIRPLFKNSFRRFPCLLHLNSTSLQLILIGKNGKKGLKTY
ncbi:unnamed protein product [Calypogeia fissa]